MPTIIRAIRILLGLKPIGELSINKIADKFVENYFLYQKVR